MSKLSFKATLPNGVRNYVAAAYAEMHGLGRPTKRRSTSHLLRVSGAFAPMEVVVEEPGESEPAGNIGFQCIADMGAILIGPRTFTCNIVQRPAELMLLMLRAWLVQTFPSIPPELLAQVAADNCQITRVTAAYYFRFPTETDAFQFMLELQNTAKVVLDCAAAYPYKRGSAAPRIPLVTSDSESRTAFRVQLRHLPLREPFGEAQVSVAREPHDMPATAAKDTVEERRRLAAAIRRVIRVLIEVDVSKTLHFDGGEEHRLPTDFREWNSSSFPGNPFEMIWKAFRYALWLNVHLATSEEDVDQTALDDAQREVLVAYFAGDPISPVATYFDDEQAYLDMRKSLIDAAHVDILTPWPILRLNQIQKLGAVLNFDDRFQPADDALFAKHTLSPASFAAAAEMIRKTLPDHVSAPHSTSEPWPMPEEA